MKQVLLTDAGREAVIVRRADGAGGTGVARGAGAAARGRARACRRTTPRQTQVGSLKGTNGMRGLAAESGHRHASRKQHLGDDPKTNRKVEEGEVQSCTQLARSPWLEHVVDARQ
jgi:hypothetical protein